MSVEEVENLKLKQGDNIKIFLRYDPKPVQAKFLQLYHNMLMWEVDFGQQGKHISEILAIQKEDKISVL